MCAASFLGLRANNIDEVPESPIPVGGADFKEVNV